MDHTRRTRDVLFQPLTVSYTLGMLNPPLSFALRAQVIAPRTIFAREASRPEVSQKVVLAVTRIELFDLTVLQDWQSG